DGAAGGVLAAGAVGVLGDQRGREHRARLVVGVRVAAELDVVGLQLRGQLLQRHLLVVVQELLLDGDPSGDGGARVLGQLADLLDAVVPGARRLDHHDRLALEPAGDDLGRQHGGELLLPVDLLLQLPLLGAGLLGGLGGLVGLLAQGVADRVRQRGGAQHDAERQRQEDRDDGDEVVAEIDHVKSPVSQKTKACQRSASRGLMTSPAGDTATAMTMATSAPKTRNSSDHVEIRLRYRRLTPLASTSLLPTRRRVRNVLAMPARPLSRNSIMLACVPTATMSEAPLSSASSIAMSSLVAVAGNVTASWPSSWTRFRPGARPSR